MSKKSRSSLVLTFVAVALVFLGFLEMKDYNALKKRCTEVTTAKIFYNEHKRMGNYADASFTVGDKEYIFRTEFSKKKYPIGKTISVRYDPTDPKVNYSPTYPPDNGLLGILTGAFLLLLPLLRFIPFGKRRDTEDD